MYIVHMRKLAESETELKKLSCVVNSCTEAVLIQSLYIMLEHVDW